MNWTESKHNDMLANSKHKKKSSTMQEGKIGDKNVAGWPR
jgi:hypothetical protein